LHYFRVSAGPIIAIGALKRLYSARRLRRPTCFCHRKHQLFLCDATYSSLALAVRRTDREGTGLHCGGDSVARHFFCFTAGCVQSALPRQSAAGCGGYPAKTLFAVAALATLALSLLNPASLSGLIPWCWSAVWRPSTGTLLRAFLSRLARSSPSLVWFFGPLWRRWLALSFRDRRPGEGRYRRLHHVVHCRTLIPCWRSNHCL